jgi:hypothetical protein
MVVFVTFRATEAKRRRVKLLFALALALFALFFMRVTWDVLYFANVNPVQG